MAARSSSSDATRAIAGRFAAGRASRCATSACIDCDDLGQPERLVQVDADGLPHDFPPLRSLDARPNNLPTQLTTFVGRERELAEAVELLRSTRLLTLTGPGGTGKTRLSLQVAAAAADAYPDGVWFVALEAVRDPEMVGPAIARTLGLVDDAARTTIEVVVDRIGEDHVLLVLDNFEQVVEAGPTIAELLRRCPNLSALVTTRVALHVSGEQEYPVPGLPAPPDTRHLSEMDRLNLPARAARARPRDADELRGRPPVHRPGELGQARLRGDERQCAGRRRPSAPPCTGCRSRSSWRRPGSSS